MPTGLGRFIERQIERVLAQGSWKLQSNNVIALRYGCIRHCKGTCSSLAFLVSGKAHFLTGGTCIGVAHI